ncbi:MAG: phosphoribosyltransferase [Candidatus Aenigmarchaeota archaeon]|nr:phosphoribosyltransferase [Candidatus Aenigmarchaeota archaeon]
MSGILTPDKVVSVLESGEFENFVNDYLGTVNAARLYADFSGWFTGLGYKETEVFAYSLGKTVNMAHNLKDDYDICIGIAKGGLFSTYVFNKLGMDTKLAEAHAGPEKSTFEWIDSVSPDELEGRRILVLECDAISGGTSKKVLEVLSNYNPGEIDISFNVEPAGGKYGYGTNVSNIPDGYGKIHFPSSFSYENFGQAISAIRDAI